MLDLDSNRSPYSYYLPGKTDWEKMTDEGF